MRTFAISREDQREALIGWLREQPLEPPLKVDVGGWPRGPSVEQHRRYRQLCRLNAAAPMAEFLPSGEIVERRYGAEAWHLYFKRQFLDPVVVELPGGGQREELPSTAKLTPEKMDEFIDRVREASAERGVHLAHPEENYA